MSWIGAALIAKIVSKFKGISGGSTHQIPQPADFKITDDTGTYEFKWNPNLGSDMTKAFNDAQDYIDQQFLEACQKRTPYMLGYLTDSGYIAGPGDIVFDIIYAKAQYYTEPTRPYDANRGGHWMSRAAEQEGARILEGASRIAGRPL